MSTTASPADVATVQAAWPVDTPTAVATPVARLPRSVLRMVSAVSWPGVQMTSSDTPRNARYDPRPITAGLSVARVRAERVGAAAAAQLVERLSLELAHRFPAHAEPSRDLVESALVPIAQPEPELDDA